MLIVFKCCIQDENIFIKLALFANGSMFHLVIILFFRNENWMVKKFLCSYRRR